VYLERIIKSLSFVGIGVVDEKSPKNSDLNNLRIVVLKGFWQNAQSLIGHKDSLKRNLVIKGPLSQRYSFLKKHIDGQKTLIMHIRRGDYLSNSKAAKYHGALSLEYFRKAYFLAFEKSSIESTVIFTDDGDFVNTNLNFISNLIVVSEADDLSAPEILDLMRYGEVLIMSNSSLSWWAGFLSDVDSRLILAPDPWFRSASMPEMYLDDWYRLDAKFENYLA
jgi:hypothetical protein